jgi:hypothetical protein
MLTCRSPCLCIHTSNFIIRIKLTSANEVMSMYYTTNVQIHTHSLVIFPKWSNTAWLLNINNLTLSSVLYGSCPWTIRCELREIHLICARKVAIRNSSKTPGIFTEVEVCAALRRFGQRRTVYTTVVPETECIYYAVRTESFNCLSKCVKSVIKHNKHVTCLT